MKPHEFFDLTPGEVTDWLAPAHRGVVERAWWTERFHRMKRLPQKSDDVFKKEIEVLGPDDLLKRAKDVVKEYNARVDKNTVVLPKDALKMRMPKKGS